MRSGGRQDRGTAVACYESPNEIRGLPARYDQLQFLFASNELPNKFKLGEACARIQARLIGLPFRPVSDAVVWDGPHHSQNLLTAIALALYGEIHVLVFDSSEGVYEERLMIRPAPLKVRPEDRIQIDA